MKDYSKYAGIIPAFYACYDEKGDISPKAVRELTEYYIGKGVKGLYVGGSSGECIYQSVAERKLLLENVMAVAKGKLTIIAHVACNNTRDSMELAAHAESLGVDAIASIPPIYFRLPDAAIAKYWNDISSAAPNTDFVIYNIPQLAGVALNPGLLATKGENLALARELQLAANQIIYKMCSGKGNMYAMIKEILRLSGGPDIGGVRAPLLNLTEDDKEIAKECVRMIAEAKAKIA